MRKVIYLGLVLSIFTISACSKKLEYSLSIKEMENLYDELVSGDGNNKGFYLENDKINTSYNFEKGIENITDFIVYESLRDKDNGNIARETFYCYSDGTSEVKKRDWIASELKHTEEIVTVYPYADCIQKYDEYEKKFLQMWSDFFEYVTDNVSTFEFYSPAFYGTIIDCEIVINNNTKYYEKGYRKIVIDDIDVLGTKRLVVRLLSETTSEVFSIHEAKE